MSGSEEGTVRDGEGSFHWPPLGTRGADSDDYVDDDDDEDDEIFLDDYDDAVEDVYDADGGDSVDAPLLGGGGGGRGGRGGDGDGGRNGGSGSIRRGPVPPIPSIQSRLLARYTGKVVQAEPVKAMLKAPGTKCLNLKYVKLLSNFAYNVNLRRYTLAPSPGLSSSPRHSR